ncbi:hypothetical protein BDV98DRAFT_514057, partial [Pterulicium gracile]
EYKGGKGGGINTNVYKEQVLISYLLSSYMEVSKELGWAKFQQDGKAAHKGLIKWLRKHMVKILPHLVSSPGLSPIEPLWYTIEKLIQSCPHS